MLKSTELLEGSFVVFAKVAWSATIAMAVTELIVPQARHSSNSEAKLARKTKQILQEH